MRLFSAYTLSEQTKEELGKVISDLKRSYSYVRYVKKENLHLTINFYGEFFDVSEVKEETRLLNKRLGGLSLKIIGLSHFNEKIIYADCNIPDNFYKQIKKINNRFKPHITLGRIKEKIPTEEKFELIENITNIPCNITEEDIKADVYESILKNDGPEYIKL